VLASIDSMSLCCFFNVFIVYKFWWVCTIFFTIVNE
jgi:hypothetical protein